MPSVTDTTIGFAIQRTDPQLQNYIVARDAAVLTGAAMLLRTMGFETFSTAVLFTGFLYETGLAVNEYGPQQSLQALRNTGMTLFAAVKNKLQPVAEKNEPEAPKPGKKSA